MELAPLFVGIDFGTSGCRAVAIDGDGAIKAEARQPSRSTGTEQSPAAWREALWALLDDLFHELGDARRQVAGISLDGTSGTVLLTDRERTPLTAALMYNDQRATEQAQRIAQLAPAESGAHGVSSGLAKALWLLAQHPGEEPRIATQTSWLLSELGAEAKLDANNALKLGYDPLAQQWPDWLDALSELPSLPEVVTPGSPLGPLNSGLAARWRLDTPPTLYAGTTDSTAAIIATGAEATGDAITSLGSTLVLKVISDTPVFAAEYGVYSQPFGDKWLVGGASNSGGAVLAHYFSGEQLAELSLQINPGEDSGLDYYPLLQPGERFPHNDPALEPRLSPRPESDAHFLHGLLEGIARIERDGYRLLQQLGAPAPQRILSAGGGAANPVWQAIRQRLTGIPVERAEQSEAAYGSALLALRGHKLSPRR